MLQPFTGDLVCWDWGDTLVDQNFMRKPVGIPGWTEAYDRVIASSDQGERWGLGQSTMRELAVLMADELDVSPAWTWRALAINLTRAEPFNEVCALQEQLAGLDQPMLQAIVTVNPHEFWAMAIDGGFHRRCDCIVTSAEVSSPSKVVMASEARMMLGLEPGLGTTLLIDNMAPNIDEFIAAGGQGWHFVRSTFEVDRAVAFPNVG